MEMFADVNELLGLLSLNAILKMNYLIKTSNDRRLL